MKKSIIIKERMPEDLLVKNGNDFIALVKPNPSTTGSNSYFYTKNTTLSSVRGYAKFSTDNSNWSNTVTVGNSDTKVYVKTTAEDGIVFGSGAFISNIKSEVKDTLILIDLENVANSKVQSTVIASGLDEFIDVFKGDVSVFAGKELMYSSGLALYVTSKPDIIPFIFGDITGVQDAKNNCLFNSKYIFGDISEMLAHHSYDSAANKQLTLYYNDTTTYDKLICTPFNRGTVAPATYDKVIVEQQMNETSIINILNSLAALPNASRVVQLNGPTSASISSAIAAFKAANGGTLTYNGVVQ